MKLYWRYKKDGKWSWKPATEIQAFIDAEGEKWVYTQEGLEEEE
jgi:hypothetical protein